MGPSKEQLGIGLRTRAGARRLASLMSRLIRYRPSAPMLVAMLALFIATGSGAYAAITLPDGSVGTKQLQSGAVTHGKLANGAVTASKVKDHALLARNFKDGQLPAGAAGPTGATGPTGPAGAPGQSATALWAVVDVAGGLVHGSHVAATTKLFSGTVAGAYQVTFDRDVTGCALIATLGRIDSQALNPDAGEIGTAYRNGSPDAVFVKTYDSTGTAADESFHLAVFC